MTKNMELKTIEMSTCVWFLFYIMFEATAVQQNTRMKKIHHPFRQMPCTIFHLRQVYKGLLTETRRRKNKLSLSTLNLETVTGMSSLATRQHIFKFGINAAQHQRLKNTGANKTLNSRNKSKQSVTNNTFIEFDMRRAFVPKRIVPRKLKSIINTTKSINNTHKNHLATRSNEVNRTALHKKDAETDSKSNFDNKVLDKIQQLENELKLMKNQVKNDTETIDKLKNKVLEKNRELSEFSLTNEFALELKNSTIYSSIKPMTIDGKMRALKRKRSRTVQRETTQKHQLYVTNRISLRKNGVHGVPQSVNDKNTTGEIKLSTVRCVKPENVTKIDEHQNIDALENQKEHELGNKEFDTGSHRMEQNYNIKKDTDVKQFFNQNTLHKDLKKTKSDGTRLNQDLDEVRLINRKEIEGPSQKEVTETSLKEDLDYDRLKVSDPTYENIEQEDYGQVKPGNNAFDNKRDNLMNYDEYKRKLQEERIEEDIDWKKFDTQSFLSQLNSEIKERSTPPPEYEDLPLIRPSENENLPMIRQSGRRMISDNTFKLLNADSLPVFNNDKPHEFKEDLTTNFYAPAPPRRRKLVLTTMVPEPTDPLPSVTFNAKYNEKKIFPNTEIPKTIDESPANVSPKNGRCRLAPQAGKQTIVLDSTELLIRNFLGKMNKGKAEAQKPYDFEVIKQKMNREGVERRKILHERIAQRMTQKISGRRNMDPSGIGYGEYDSKELFKDPFLNDSYI